MFNAGKENDEESVEILEEVPNEMIDLWHEIILLENRLVIQGMNILNVQLKLNKVEAHVSHDKEESILELKEDELITRINQGDERKLLDVVKREEKCYARNDGQHSDFLLVRIQAEIELLKRIENIERRMSQAIVEAEIDASIHIYDMIAGIQKTMSKYVVAVKDLEDNKEQKRDIAEGDFFKYIQEVWVAPMFGTTSTTISRTKA
jgi:hypothetical protein